MVPDTEIYLLALMAASIAFFHTLLGPDHYLPFIAMGKAKQWSFQKTLLITFLCGLGHVTSSIVIGLVGILAGAALGSLEFIEKSRGEVAAWLLLSFGFLYMVWGIKRAKSGKSHKHHHVHSDGTIHSHPHHHIAGEHKHVHEEPIRPFNLTPWILFTIFVFGPCEPLIPILMFPAIKQSMSGLLIVTGVFSLVTLVTMVGIVGLAYYGLSFLPLNRLERYMHAMAGGVVFLSGVGMVFLGL